jgi:hypothetical protein
MDNIKLFEDKKVRTLWDAEQEKWYISLIDVIAVLTESERPRKYWSDLKGKLLKEGSELSEKIGQLKMLAEASTKDISQAVNPKDFEESKKIAQQGGTIAGNARKELETKTGKKVVTELNAQKFLVNKNGK